MCKPRSEREMEMTLAQLIAAYEGRPKDGKEPLLMTASEGIRIMIDTLAWAMGHDSRFIALLHGFDAIDSSSTSVH